MKGTIHSVYGNKITVEVERLHDRRFQAVFKLHKLNETSFLGREIIIIT
jgi:hypothetical protein